MTQKVRVRFAPSPTGPLHIGGVRTALFNYLFAKKHGGDFVLRIEDTDQNRFVEGAEQYIVDALEWCGIPFDEGIGKDGGFGPYRQSERKHLYRKYADELIEKGHAYYAFDTAEALDAHRKEHEAKGKTFIYNWHNRLKLTNSLSLSAEEVQAKLDAGEPYVIRFKSPQGETLHLQDIVRGDVEIDTNILDDKILFKSDGMPTYHLANIVDDHLMEITHVIRGEEWLPSLALHNLLYRSFGWEAPQFAHLPLILKPTGKGKLSKRDGAKFGFPVFPMEWHDDKEDQLYLGFKEEGYFDDALINFLAFLGWNPGTEQEIFSLEELIEAFELERINKAGARFDIDKMQWFNQQYMHHKSNEYLAKSFQALRPELNGIDIQYIEMVVGLVKERVSFVKELWDESHFFFVAPTEFDEKAQKKALKEGTDDILRKLIDIINSTEEYTVESLQTNIKGWITDNEIGFGKVMQPLRFALAGALSGPDLFTIMFMIGKQETIKRIEKVLGML
ncbi:glutamyl-tRNA synthetase [Kordia periserrulae]|uniref:Glutamate--tRNA ligase n=1 Tax=Kordia periserrulae TaxID=701523 RepID=A0A2T6BX04_9FLAO|nr:glutamate--tRNA ligase [Kordia periserrulae]PTX60487.1 glutamyl-tRNA synthetase [Kordia periserrulae]